jgi:hypothetical protein
MPTLKGPDSFAPAQKRLASPQTFPASEKDEPSVSDHSGGGSPSTYSQTDASTRSQDPSIFRDRQQIWQWPKNATELPRNWAIGTSAKLEIRLRL